MLLTLPMGASDTCPSEECGCCPSPPIALKWHQLLDTFLAFIAVMGVIEFVYCILVGNFVCVLLLSRFSRQPSLPPPA